MPVRRWSSHGPLPRPPHRPNQTGPPSPCGEICRESFRQHRQPTRSEHEGVQAFLSARRPANQPPAWAWPTMVRMAASGATIRARGAISPGAIPTHEPAVILSQLQQRARHADVIVETFALSTPTPRHRNPAARRRLVWPHEPVTAAEKPDHPARCAAAGCPRASWCQERPTADMRAAHLWPQ